VKAELVLFDFDGTLADSFPGIVASFQHALKSVGVNGIANEQIHCLIGSPLEKMFEALVSEEKHGLAEEFLANYRKHYPENALANTRLFPHVKETLQALKERGKKLAVATTKKHENIDPLLKGLGIAKLFDFVLGYDDVENTKPAPDMILLGLEKAGTEAEKAVMVGDHVFDVKASVAAGVKAIGVSFGSAKAEELEEAGAVVVISDFSELLGIID